MTRRALRGLVVLAFTVLAALAGAGTAFAHADLVSSNLVDGTNLPAAPPRLELRFSLPVELATAKVGLTDAADRPYAVGAAQALASGPGGVTAFASRLSPVPRGSYRLTWSVLSSDDLHVVSGVIAFGVQQEAPAATAISDPAPDMFESAARWVGFAGLAALLGAAALATLLGAVRDDARRSEARRVLAGLAVAGGALGLAGDVALLVAQSAAAAGTGGSVADALVRLLDTPPRAPRWWSRELALAVLLGCAIAARRATRRGRGLPAAVVLLGIAATVTVGATGAMLGHSVGSGVVRVATDALHELSALTWAGGLLAVVAVTARRPRDAATKALLNRFSLLAAACVALLTVTGLMLTGSGVASLDALLLSHFGAALMVKVGLMGVALAVALVNTIAVHRTGLRPPRTALVVEAGVVVAALGAAAVLGASPHATGGPWRVPDASVALQTSQADDLVESLAVTPNLPGGPNVVTVTVLNSRRPAPAPIGAVSVGLVGSDGAVVTGTARPIGGGAYALTVPRPPAGPWSVRVSVARTGLPRAVADYRWVVTDPSAPRHAPVYSAEPIDAPLGIAAAAVALVALVAAAVIVVRRRGRRPAPATAEEVEHVTV